MTIQNELYTDLGNFDLTRHIEKNGPPHYPTKHNPVGVLNERFWAALLAIHNEILFENHESEFYKYLPSVGIYEPFSNHLLLDQIANDVWSASENWPGYGALAQLCDTRHLSGVATHLKGLVQKEGAFDQQRNYIHVKNGIIDLSSGSPNLSDLILISSAAIQFRSITIQAPNARSFALNSWHRSRKRIAPCSKSFLECIYRESISCKRS